MGKLVGKNKARERKAKHMKEKVSKQRYMRSLSERILLAGSPELKMECQSVTSKKDLVFEKDKKTIDIVKDLKKVVCSTKNGVGLAANQLGYNKKVFVVREVENGINILTIFINPEVIKENDVKLVSKEGCLSYPGFYCDVERSWKIEVQYLNEMLEKKTEELIGLKARIFLHELEHLYGRCSVGEKYEEQNKDNSPVNND